MDILIYIYVIIAGLTFINEFVQGIRHDVDLNPIMLGVVSLFAAALWPILFVFRWNDNN